MCVCEREERKTETIYKQKDREKEVDRERKRDREKRTTDPQNINKTKPENPDPSIPRPWDLFGVTHSSS